MCFPGGSNVGDTLPTGQLSNVPWRRAGVKYTNNEAYFDVIEEIDAILDKSGTNNHLFFFLDYIIGPGYSLNTLVSQSFFFRYDSVCRDPGCN